MKSKMLSFVFLLAVLAALLWWGNTVPGATEYTIRSPKLPEGFSGLRIAQVSDLHNDSLGKGNRYLLALLKKTNPDIIVITGDLVDSRRTDISAAADFAQQAADIAPCFYVTGNHESRLPQEDFHVLEETLTKAGIYLLPDKKVTLSRGEDSITLTGLWEGSSVADVSQRDGFHILLAHRPEPFGTYAERGYDLVFSGHAHGGQFRIPFLGGLFAPDQGLFPEYDAGVFSQGNCQMVVSRGLGNSLFPLRLGNPPELVVATLTAQ